MILPAVLLIFLSGCSGNSNSSGPAAPLPNSQTGSLVANDLSNGNCYVTSTSTSTGFTACTAAGTSGITALAAGTVGSTNYLFMGNKAGYIASPNSLTTAPPTVVTTCTTSPSPLSTINALAINTSGTGSLYAATSGGIYYSTSLSTCSASSINSSITNATGLTYNVPAGTVVGITSNDLYFTCTTTCTTPTLLPSLQGSPSPQITAIASDPVYSIVYITAIGANTDRIYFYYVSGTSLTYLGNYTGTELSAPAGLALFQGSSPTQNYCTSGACTFLDVANPGNNTITQYVLTYSGSAPNLGVSINQFNNAYFNCEIINPSSIAALPKPSSGSLLNQPDVFVGENGTSLGPCLGIVSGTFGNNVTAYTVNKE